MEYFFLFVLSKSKKCKNIKIIFNHSNVHDVRERDHVHVRLCSQIVRELEHVRKLFANSNQSEPAHILRILFAGIDSCRITSLVGYILRILLCIYRKKRTEFLLRD